MGPYKLATGFYAGDIPYPPNGAINKKPFAVYNPYAGQTIIGYVAGNEVQFINLPVGILDVLFDEVSSSSNPGRLIALWR